MAPIGIFFARPKRAKEKDKDGRWKQQAGVQNGRPLAVALMMMVMVVMMGMMMVMMPGTQTNDRPMMVMMMVMMVPELNRDLRDLGG